MFHKGKCSPPGMYIRPCIYFFILLVFTYIIIKTLRSSNKLGIFNMKYYQKALKEYCYTEYHLQTQDVNLKEKTAI